MFLMTWTVTFGPFFKTVTALTLYLEGTYMSIRFLGEGLDGVEMYVPDAIEDEDLAVWIILVAGENLSL